MAGFSQLNAMHGLRSLRPGCRGGLLALVFLIVLGCCLLAWLLVKALIPAAHAGGDPCAAGDPAYRYRAVALAPAIPEAPRERWPAGSFYTMSLVVVLAGDGPVFLSSQPDRLADLATDDQATLVVRWSDGTQHAWSHDFRAPDRMRVIPIPAQDISWLFATGSHAVEITLADLTPYTWSTRAYYLLACEPALAPATATAVPESGTDGRASPSPRARAPTPTRRAGGLPVISPSPKATLGMTAPTLAPGIHEVQGVDAAGQAVPAAAAAQGGHQVAVWPWLLGTALAGILILLGLTPRRGRWHADAKSQGQPTRAWFGWLGLYDRVTRESLGPLALPEHRRGLDVRLDPLRTGALEAGAELAPEAVVWIRPAPDGPLLIAPAGTARCLTPGHSMVATSTARAACSALWDQDLDHAREGGGAPLQAWALEDGDTWDIVQRLEVEFRNPLALPRRKASWRGGAALPHRVRRIR